VEAVDGVDTNSAHSSGVVILTMLCPPSDTLSLWMLGRRCCRRVLCCYTLFYTLLTSILYTDHVLLSSVYFVIHQAALEFTMN